MNVENFAAWLRQTGHKVYKTKSSYWYTAGPRVLQAFPYHWLIEPDEKEINDLLRGKNLLALRYSTSLEAPKGVISYHVVYDHPEYSLELLDRRSRQNVNKGLKNCTVEPISFTRLAEEGWQLESDTLDRQSREGQHDSYSWKMLCRIAESIPGFEAWGAIVDGKLAASLLTFQQGDCCEMLYQQCRREYLNDRVNNALTYTVSQLMMQRSPVKMIFYALHSLDAPPNVDEYKFRMNYRAKPVRQRVVFHPFLSIFLNRFSYNLIDRLQKGNTRSHRLAKAKGMFQFYLQGLLPLEQQAWPGALEPEKEMILHSLQPGLMEEGSVQQEFSILIKDQLTR